MKNIKNFRVKGFDVFALQYGRDTQLKMDRGNCIGSSDIGSIMGVNPYCSKYKLYLEKTGAIPVEFDDAKRKKMAIGKMMESFIISVYLEIHGIECQDVNMDSRFTKGSFTAQCDAIVNNTIFEIKNIDKFYGQYIVNGQVAIPKYYEYQMYWQMYLSGIKQAKLLVYNNSEQQLYELDCHYPSSDVIEQMISEANDFLKCLETRHFATDKFNNVEDLGLINSKPNGVNYLPVKSQYDELLVLTEQLKNYEKRIDELKDDIKLYMQDNDTLVKDDKTILTFKTSKSNRIDSEILKSRYPEVYKDCLKESTLRIFKLITPRAK